eukprot:1786139-Pleurochrysis_carterae.AAC.1
MGLTPAQDGTLPVNLSHGGSLGASRSGSVEETSVDDLRWYHQYEAGCFDVASLALMSRAIVAAPLSFAGPILPGHVW